MKRLGLGALLALTLSSSDSLHSAATTLVLENFESYTSLPLAITGGGASLAELSDTQPGTALWTDEGTNGEGNSSVVTGGANSSTASLALTHTDTAPPIDKYDNVITFPAISEQYFFFEVSLNIPVGARLLLLGEDIGDADGISIDFVSGSASFPTGSAATYPEGTWFTLKVFANQSGPCTNNACFDVYFNGVQAGATRGFAANWSSRQLAKLTFSTRVNGTYGVDELRVYKDTVVPPQTDSIAPSVLANAGTSIFSTQVNPHLDLTFLDTGTGADLATVQYRFNSPTATYQYFTSDGSTLIGTDLSGTSYTPTSLMIRTAEWASIASDGSATIYIRVQDDAANVNTPDTQITLYKGSVVSNPTPSGDLSGAIAAPSIVNLSKVSQVVLLNLTFSTRVRVYHDSGRKVFDEEVSAPAGTYALNISSQFSGAVRNGTYFVILSNAAGETRRIKFAILR